MAARPLPNIANTVRCSVQGLTATGQPWVNVHHMRHTSGAPTVSDITQLHVELERFYFGPDYTVPAGNEVLQFCKSNVSMTQVAYTPLDGTSITTVIAANHPGTSPTTLNAPQEVACVLTLRTANRGRRYRGRLYLPPFASDMFDASGLLVAGASTSIIGQWNGMKTALTAKQWEPVVASYGYSLLKNGTVSTWTPFATQITTVTMDTKPDVQRRRK